MHAPAEAAASPYLSRPQLWDQLQEGLARLPVDGKRVLVLIPDGTRTMPMPTLFEMLNRALRSRVTALDYLVALGTHSPMDDAQLSRLVGAEVREGQVGDARIFNHRWDDPKTFVSLGVIPKAEIEQITGGRLSADVPVALNRLVVEYEHVVICGPVFPHEVAGFSGGTKYLFPGIAASEIIHFTHWLGALITNYEVIGTIDTPVRAVIDRAAALVPTPLSLVALVVTHEGVKGMSIGPVATAWRRAAELSARTHVRWLQAPLRQVLSVMPEMYDDLWVAAKGAYKMEPAMADGGEIIIYAPHVRAVSHVHGALIEQIGYHCRDYFMKQWDRYGGYPGGILAHSTHVKGLGTYDVATRVESPRVHVTLATGIGPDVCRRINLGYLDPSTVDLDDWPVEVEQGRLKVPRAGELLYRLGQPPGSESSS